MGIYTRNHGAMRYTVQDTGLAERRVTLFEELRPELQAQALGAFEHVQFQAHGLGPLGVRELIIALMQIGLDFTPDKIVGILDGNPNSWNS